jgi:hypothetical protein
MCHIDFDKNYYLCQNHGDSQILQELLLENLTDHRDSDIPIVIPNIGYTSKRHRDYVNFTCFQFYPIQIQNKTLLNEHNQVQHHLH